MKLEVGDEVRSDDLWAFNEWQTITSIQGDQFQCNQMLNYEQDWWFITDQFLCRSNYMAPTPPEEIPTGMGSNALHALLHYVNLETLEEHLPFMVKTLKKYRDGETLVSTAEYKHLNEVLEKFP